MKQPEQEVLDAPVKVAEYSTVDAGLAELREKVAKTAYDIKTTDGDKTARALRSECVSLRTSIETRRQEAKKPLLEKGRLLDAEANRIKAEILAIETPIDSAIKAEEKRKSDEKIAKERAEAEARRKIDQAIADIQYCPVHASGKTADEIENLVVELSARQLEQDFYGDRLNEAVLAKNATLEKLRAMVDAARHQEAEAARLQTEREAAERVRQEQEAAAERLRQAQADLERQKRELAEQQERAERERVQREWETANPVEAPRAVLRTEEQRQAAISDALDAGSKALLAPLPEPVDDSNPFPPADAVPFPAIDEAEDFDGYAPPADDMVEIIADHYDVTPNVARQWLENAFGVEP